MGEQSSEGGSSNRSAFSQIKELVLLLGLIGSPATVYYGQNQIAESQKELVSSHGRLETTITKVVKINNLIDRLEDHEERLTQMEADTQKLRDRVVFVEKILKRYVNGN